MKIIFVTPKLNFKTAGGSVFDIDLKARAFQELGAEVSFVTVFSQFNIIDHPLTYSVSEEHCKRIGQLGITWEVYKILKKYESQADFFHVDGHIFPYGPGLYRALGGKVPVIAFYNRELVVFPRDIPHYEFGIPDEPPPPFLKRVKEWLRFRVEKYIGSPIASAVDIAVFTSPVLQREYNNFGFRSPIQLYSPDLAGDIQERTTIPAKPTTGKVHFLAAGRLIPTKGFDLMLTAFARMKNRPAARLTIAGGGPDEARLKELARTLGISSEVTFTGWLTHDKLFPLFDTADVFVLPRWRRELTSVVMMEAMSHGLACIIPDSGGVEWQAGEGALTFTYDDPSSLTLALEKMLEPGYRKEMAEKALARLSDLHYRNWVPPQYNAMLNVSSQKKR